MISIEKVIKNYTEGTYEANESKLKSVFWDDAIMHGYLGSELVAATPQLFIDDMLSNPSMKSKGDKYEPCVESIVTDGRVATVTLSESGFKGDGKLVNFFHLVERDGEWRIISKLFTTK